MSKNSYLSGTSIILASAFFSLCTQAVSAQNINSLTQSGHQNATTIKNSVKTWTDTQAINDLENLANSGDNSALYHLGELYSRGPIEIDVNRAISYYEKSALAGNSGANFRLSEIYSDGRLVDRDLAKSRQYLDSAISSGNSLAIIRSLEDGIRTSSNTEDKNSLFHKLLDYGNKGNATALSSISSLYLDGTFDINFPLAVQYLEKAGKAGNSGSYVKIAEMYNGSIFTKKDSQQSIYYLNKAVEAGNRDALRILGDYHARGKFGGLSKPSLGVNYINSAIENGDPSAPSALASLYIWGIGVEKSPAKAVKVLSRAADSGNVQAAQSLLSLHREGRPGSISKNINKARVYLDKYANLFNPTDFNIEDVLLLGAGADGINDLSKFSDKFDSLPNNVKSKVFISMRSANPNSYTYLLQSKLKDNGHFSGKMNGFMNSSTIKATQEFCNTTSTPVSCIKGPLDHSTAVYLANTLFT